MFGDYIYIVDLYLLYFWVWDKDEFIFVRLREITLNRLYFFFIVKRSCFLKKLDNLGENDSF